jgi:hypothetical protein
MVKEKRSKKHFSTTHGYKTAGRNRTWVRPTMSYPDLSRVDPQPLFHSQEKSAYNNVSSPLQSSYPHLFPQYLKSEPYPTTFQLTPSSESIYTGALTGIGIGDGLSSVSFINTIYQKKKMHAPPNYEFSQVTSGHTSGFIAKLSFFGTIFHSETPKPKKQDAKEEVARIAVNKLQRIEPELVEEIQKELGRSGKSIKPLKREISNLKSEIWLSKQDTNKRWCVILLEFCQTYKLSAPTYKQSHDFQGNYIFEVEVGTRRFKSPHARFSKKDAQDSVAKVAFDILFKEQLDREQEEQEMFKCPLPKYSSGLAGRDVFNTAYMHHGVGVGVNVGDVKLYEFSNRQSCSYSGIENYDPIIPPSVPDSPIPGCAPTRPQMYDPPTNLDPPAANSSFYSVPIGAQLDNTTSHTSTPFASGLFASGLTAADLGAPPTSRLAETMATNGYMPHMPPQPPPPTSTHHMSPVMMPTSPSGYYNASPFSSAPRAATTSATMFDPPGYAYNTTPLKKRYVSLLYEAAQARKWEAPNFTMHSTQSGGFIGEVRFMGHIFRGRSAYPKKAEAKEDVSELAYKYYVECLNSKR